METMLSLNLPSSPLKILRHQHPFQPRAPLQYIILTSMMMGGTITIITLNHNLCIQVEGTPPLSGETTLQVPFDRPIGMITLGLGPATTLHHQPVLIETITIPNIMRIHERCRAEVDAANSIFEGTRILFVV